MGSIIYGYLSQSVLLHEPSVRRRFSGIPEEELRKALQQYREFCIQHLAELAEQVRPQAGRLRLFPGSMATPQLLKQAAWYLDTVVLSDPLFSLTEQEHPFTAAMLAATPELPTRRFDRDAIARAAAELIAHRSLVDCGYVAYYPTSLQGEIPAEIPMYAPTDAFEGLLPADLLAIYRRHATVRSVMASPRGLLVLNALEPGRRINISFDPDAPGAFGYELREMEVVAKDEASGTFTVRTSLPDTLPSQSSFDAWVHQSINKSAHQHHVDLMRDVAMAGRFGAHYLTTSSFATAILDPEPGTPDIKSATASGLLQMSLPFFEQVPLPLLMAARADEEAFHRFRLQLEKHFRELRLEVDPIKRKARSENAMHELLEIQLTEIDSAVRRLRRKTAWNVAAATASLVAAIPTGGASLFGSAYAAYKGIQAVEEYRISARENPAYLLWKANGKRRRTA